ncbi:hypothetical protein C8Q76DRAFT_690086 [Earliella scabrosa]|nr:hypothetical protein C8Q76DRAFT_690086 [Earliella scabrosa]
MTLARKCSSSWTPRGKRPRHWYTPRAGVLAGLRAWRDGASYQSKKFDSHLASRYQLQWCCHIQPISRRIAATWPGYTFSPSLLAPNQHPSAPMVTDDPEHSRIFGYLSLPAGRMSDAASTMAVSERKDEHPDEHKRVWPAETPVLGQTAPGDDTAASPVFYAYRCAPQLIFAGFWPYENGRECTRSRRNPDGGMQYVRTAYSGGHCHCAEDALLTLSEPQRALDLNQPSRSGKLGVIFGAGSGADAEWPAEASSMRYCVQQQRSGSPVHLSTASGWGQLRRATIPEEPRSGVWGISVPFVSGTATLTQIAPGDRGHISMSVQPQRFPAVPPPSFVHGLIVHVVATIVVFDPKSSTRGMRAGALQKAGMTGLFITCPCQPREPITSVRTHRDEPPGRVAHFHLLVSTASAVCYALADCLGVPSTTFIFHPSRMQSPSMKETNIALATSLATDASSGGFFPERTHSEGPDPAIDTCAKSYQTRSSETPGYGVSSVIDQLQVQHNGETLLTLHWGESSKTARSAWYVMQSTAPKYNVVYV